jgi:hypothetical protein
LLWGYINRAAARSRVREIEEPARVTA